jgi:Fe-S-cluster containining protein
MADLPIAAYPRTTCACPACVACCKRQPGSLAPGDLERIAAHLGETVEDVRQHFWASPGALVMDTRTGRQFHIGTITPRLVRSRCVFLDEHDRCRVHPVAPAGCAKFDTHMGREEGATRGAALAREQQDPAYQQQRAKLPFATSWSPRLV